MKRHEIAAIIGSYSRQGFAAEAVPGGFLVDGAGYRTVREARIDTGVRFDRIRHDTYRTALNFDLR
jgi:hypothetical protein